jgi:predicted enzyme related to lactoylglutathione lyase
MTEQSPVVHFEMPYEDLERVSAFYGEAFGWGMQAMGPDMGDYILAATGETGADGRPTAPGTINGGFFPKRPDAPDHPSVVLAVADIEAAARRVADAGGEVLGEVIEIPGVGRYLSFLDTEGNRVGALQPST